MKILSHRGYWKNAQEKNLPVAFHRSFELGFGTETDIRDLAGELVISHDPPLGPEMRLREFLKLYDSYRQTTAESMPLALNIKSDGLQRLLQAELSSFQSLDYFVFDMSVPDLLGYQRAGLVAFTRLSDVETSPSLLEKSAGIWVDCFFEESVSFDEIGRQLSQSKQVCLVSPELHGRSHLPLWRSIKELAFIDNDALMLCTDYPEEARGFFATSGG